MALLSAGAGHTYAQVHMPSTKFGNGPWGEAIRYWLPRRNMNQADLARETGIEPKSISSMARGFPTTTKQLEKVAIALKVNIEDVLVSPERREARVELARLIAGSVDVALRQHEARIGAPVEGEPEADHPPATIATAITDMQVAVSREEKRQKSVRRALTRRPKKKDQKKKKKNT